MAPRTQDIEPDPPPQADFGYRRVDRDAKPGLVRDLFAGVSRRYDVMNDAMSLGLHRLWKDAMVDLLAPRPGMQVLDLAGGTGDVAFRIQERCRMRAEVTVCDLTAEMLETGQQRREAEHAGSSILWACGDGAGLPFAAHSFDAVTIAFGLRNVADRARVLQEMFRTLRIGGRMVCLEFSRVHPPAMAALYDAWSFGVIPRIGAAVARDRDAYRYLVESIRRFPGQAALAEEMRIAGFGRVQWRNLSLGVAALHSAWRL